MVLVTDRGPLTMGAPGDREILVGLVARVRDDPGVTAEITEAARAGSPALAALPQEEVSRHIAALVAAVTGTFVDPSTAPAVAIAAEELALDRAWQGVPLAAMLEGFRAGRARILTRLFEEAADAGVPTETIVEGLVALDGTSSELQNRFIAAYREAERTLARTSSAVRAGALRELLSGVGEHRLADTGLDPGRRYLLIVTDVTDPREARAIEPGLLSAAGGDGGLATLVDGRLCAVVPLGGEAELPEGIVAVTSGPVTPGEMATVHTLCRRGLEAAARLGRTGSLRLADLAVDVALDPAAPLATMLAGELLGRLDAGDQFHRLLAATALAFLEESGRVDAAAAHLHVHPNTVKHRLRRFDELTGYRTAGPRSQSLRSDAGW